MEIANVIGIRKKGKVVVKDEKGKTLASFKVRKDLAENEATFNKAVYQFAITYSSTFMTPQK